jgi:hypothetical protein
MDKFLNWMRNYNPEISWFIIGVLVQSGLTKLATREWEWALVDFGIALLNFLLYRKG